VSGPARQQLLARLRDENGSIALYFAIVALAAFAMLGLVVDGGQAFASRERAADLATQAARSAADALTPESVRGQPTDLRADPAAARLAANKLVSAAGARLDDVTVDGDQVSVTVTIHRPTAILSAVGLNEISQTASATATAVYGGTTPYGGG
jgi:Flp pilus assembly protein TadG